MLLQILKARNYMLSRQNYKGYECEAPLNVYDGMTPARARRDVRPRIASTVDPREEAASDKYT